MNDLNKEVNTITENKEYKKAAESAYSYATSSYIIWLSFIPISVWRIPQKLDIARKSNDPEVLKTVVETIKIYNKMLLSWVFMFVLFLTFINIIIGLIFSLFVCFVFYYLNKKYFWLYSINKYIILIVLIYVLSILIKSRAIIS